MNERNKQFKWLSAIMMILTVTAIMANIWSLTLVKGIWIYKVLSILSVLACLVALYYGLKGYRKNEAAAYKTYIILYAFIPWVSTISHGFYLEGTMAAVTTGCMALQFACAAIIAVAENLGKKKSLILCGIIVTLTFAAFVVCVFVSPGFFRGGDVIGTLSMIRTGSNTLLAFVAFVLTMAKYKDKQLRETN